MAGQGGEEKPTNVVSPTGYCYSDGNPNTHHLFNQLQSFEPNSSEIYSLTSGMEMMGFQTPKHTSLQHHDINSALWKGLFFAGRKSGDGPSSSKAVEEVPESQFYHHQDHDDDDQFTTSAEETLMVAPETAAAWHHHDQSRLLLDDSSLRCVFPCEGNERPSQGLSLSLSSSNPSTIGLQSFELRQQDHDHQDLIRFVPSGSYAKSMNNSINQQNFQQDGVLGKAAASGSTSSLHHHGQFQIRNSKYLGPAQDLLNEFCNLGTKQTGPKTRTKPHKASSQWQDDHSPSSSSKKPCHLYTLDLLELQKRKSKLLSMLEQLDRRYRHYCDQMKAVVSSFEAMAGGGAAEAYSAMASKAMSRHFRCLRDGIVGQIKATKQAMGDKDIAAPGTTRGETPRLRLLDQTLRQQKAFQQMSSMESHPWRPQRGLPERSVSVLRAWLFEHFLHPYPSDVDKHILARQTGLSRSQVANWFINARVRLWKPMVEEMYLEEMKDQQLDSNEASPEDNNGRPTQNSQVGMEDQKPIAACQLARIDSDCLSSIINNPETNDGRSQNACMKNHQNMSFGDAFGAVELDFSSYGHQAGGGHSYAGGNAQHNLGGGGEGGNGGGVSLTLGLQQHGGGGVSLGFSPAAQSSLFYSRDQMEDCQPVQYSLLDGEGQNLPYRFLMGAQLLHDLAG